MFDTYDLSNIKTLLNYYLLTWIVTITIFATDSRNTATVVRALSISTRSIPTWRVQAFVYINLTVLAFPTISTKAFVSVNTILTSSTILTWVRSTIVNIDIAMLVGVTRLAYTFVALKKIILSLFKNI